MKSLVCLLFLGLCLFPSYLLAQSTSATISGGVTDPSGRFIEDAEVDIANDTTGVIYSVKTNSSGIYFVPILPPGHYHVQVSKIGFKTIIKPDVILNVQSAVGLNFSLPVGAKSESITVDAASLSLNTTDASVSTMIDRKFVENIPLNGRSFQDLISLTPGTVTQTPQNTQASVGYAGDFSVNGQRTESNYYTVDGVSGNSGAGNGYGGAQPGTSGGLAASTALGTTQSLVSVDALQEFRVQSSTYSAEYGRSPGGQFSLATRSGTSIVHGSAFDYLRNNFFDANDWFSDHYQVPLAALRQNDFGGTVGGPLVVPGLLKAKDKTFFFFSYEGLRLTQPQAASIQYVPDGFLRTQAPAALQPILDAFPVQNGIDYGSAASPNLAQFIQGYTLPSSIDSTSIRADHNFGSKFQTFFRFSDTPSFTTSRSLSVLTESHSNIQTYTFGLTGQLRAQLVDEFRLGYTDSNAGVLGKLDSFGGAQVTNLASAAAQGSYSNPQLYFDLIASGIGFAALSTTTANNQSRQWNAVDILSLDSGHQQFRFGIDYRHMVSPLVPASPLIDAIYVGPKSVLQNNASILLLERYLGSTPVFDQLAAFAQDTWRATPTLSVSLGLRWELSPPPTAQDGYDAFTLLGNVGDPSSLQLAPRGTSLWKTSWLNFAPRLGVAWSLRNTPGWETVVRTGGGVFYDSDNEVAINGFNGLGFSAYKESFGAALPVSQAALDFSPSIDPPYTSSSIFAFPRHLQLPYTLEWNVSLEQALHKSQVFTISYVGSNGRRLVQLQQLDLAPVNPTFGTVFYIPSGITSNYQALQVQFQRSVTQGLHLLAAYTWSHSLDYGSNASALPVTRGNSDFDVRNNANAGLSWDLPTLTSRKAAAAVLDHWGLDSRLITRTAFPITLQGNLLTDPATGSQYYGNLDLVSGQPLYLHGDQYPGGRAINPAAFSTPAGNTQGTAPRNFVRGFDETQWNTAVRRTFPIYKEATLQFRAEAFNILNHPNFGYVDPLLTDATFGQATKMLNSSLGTMAPQYQQGGARSMQFSLRLSF